MTDAAGDRPQDVGRKHSRQGTPSLETLELLERYHAAMRLELEALIEEVGGYRIVGQLPAFDERPSLERRRELWTLAVKLGRELASERGAGELEPEVAARRRARPAPTLTVAARRALGQ